MDPRSYYLIGVLSGWLGSLIHNNFDVSIRFVSSGIFMGLLPALAVSLALSDRIWQEVPERAPSTGLSGPNRIGPVPVYRKAFLAVLKIAAVLACGYVAVKVCREFY